MIERGDGTVYYDFGDEPDDELFIAADATSPSPEWPAIDDLEDLEGAAFAAQQQRLNSEAA